MHLALFSCILNDIKGHFFFLLVKLKQIFSYTSSNNQLSENNKIQVT